MRISADVGFTKNNGTVWWTAGVVYIDGVEANPRHQLDKQIGIGSTREEALENLKKNLRNPDNHLVEFEI